MNASFSEQLDEPSFYQNLRIGEKYYNSEEKKISVYDGARGTTCIFGALILSPEAAKGISPQDANTLIEKRISELTGHKSPDPTTSTPFEGKNPKGVAFHSFLDPVPLRSTELYKRHLCQGESLIIDDPENLRLGTQKLRYRSNPDTILAFTVTSRARRVGGVEKEQFIIRGTALPQTTIIRIKTTYTSPMQAPVLLCGVFIKRQFWKMEIMVCERPSDLSLEVGPTTMRAYHVETNGRGVEVSRTGATTDGVETEDTEKRGSISIKCLLLVLESVVAETENPDLAFVISIFDMLRNQLLRK
jgi:hypothetical protein